MTREKDIRVRFRIDGRLQDFRNYLVIYIRLLYLSLNHVNMDIAETRRPNGRILFNSQHGRLDLRISTYPTYMGKKQCYVY